MRSDVVGAVTDQGAQLDVGQPCLSSRSRRTLATLRLVMRGVLALGEKRF